LLIDADNLSVEIGFVIKQARAAAGLTQQGLAERAHVHRVYIAQLEADLKSPTLDVLERIATALGARTSTLVARAERSNDERK
jgi:transcriptional regulator with XRE-family HTH domain